MIKRLLAVLFYFGAMASGNAAICETRPLSGNAPGLVLSGDTTKQIEAAFPTYRDVSWPTSALAVLWIDPRDCTAPNLDARVAVVEKALGRKVMLQPTEQNFRPIRAYAYPEVITTRQLKQLYPSLTARGDKIGVNMEVLVVAASDFQAPDADARRAKAAGIVGRPVELQMQP